MRIAVYCGSFDPLHIGHRAILEQLSKSPDFDWTYLVISPQNPFKSAEKALSADRRYEDAVEAVLRRPELHVWVEDIELRMAYPSYTIRTLDALKAREPGNEFTVIIGADNIEGLPRWKDADRLLKEYGIAAFPREGFDSEALRKALLDIDHEYKIKLLDMPLVNISSTAIREGLAAGKDMSEYAF